MLNILDVNFENIKLWFIIVFININYKGFCVVINRSWLSTFRTLVETGHFTQTAKRLHMTQPGVSQHIKKLEEYLGYALIIRQKREFELTEQGRMAYEHAVHLDKQEALLSEQMGFDAPYDGVCKISCSGSLAQRIYPRILSLQKSHPNLVTYLESAPNNKIRNDVRAGEIDLGIVTETQQGSGLKFTHLGNDELCLIVPKTSSSIKDWRSGLNKLGLINHPDAYHYASIYFVQSGLGIENLNVSEVPISGYVNQLSQILLPVSNGLGFTVLPKSASMGFHKQETIHVVEPKVMVKEDLYMVTTQQKKLPARYDIIIQNVIEALK